MGRVGKLVRFGKPFEERDQSLLCGRMEVQARLIEEENCVLMSAFGFDKKNKVKREEPLESLTAGFKLDFHVWTEIVGDPDSEVVAVGVIANLVATLRPPPFREFLADISRRHLT